MRYSTQSLIRRLLSVILLPVFITGCVSVEEAREVERQRIQLAAREKALAEAQKRMGQLVDQALRVGDYVKEPPKHCMEPVASNVVVGERLDVAYVKVSAALEDANVYLIECTKLLQKARQTTITVKSYAGKNDVR